MKIAKTPPLIGPLFSIAIAGSFFATACLAQSDDSRKTAPTHDDSAALNHTTAISPNDSAKTTADGVRAVAGSIGYSTVTSQTAQTAPSAASSGELTTIAAETVYQGSPITSRLIQQAGTGPLAGESPERIIRSVGFETFAGHSSLYQQTREERAVLIPESTKTGHSVHVAPLDALLAGFVFSHYSPDNSVTVE